MTLEIQISLNRTDSIKRLIAHVEDKRALHAEMGVALVSLVSTHIVTVMVPKPNRLGAPSTGWWGRAAQSVIGDVNDDRAIARIPHRGVALQYYGGTVRPVKKRALTIPIDAAAHGKTTSDFSDLVLLRSKGGESQGVLARKIGQGKTARLQPLFALRASTTIKPNPDALPTPEQLRDAARTAALSYFNRFPTP